MERDLLDGSGAVAREQARRAQAAAEDDDTAEGLAALSRLSSARLGLEDLLTSVATLAVQAVLNF